MTAPDSATQLVAVEAPEIPAATVDRARQLTDRYGEADVQALLSAMIHDEFAGRIALISSFGAEAAILLHMISRIEPATPVIFLDTGKLFGETLRYRDQLMERFGLTDVRSVQPDPRRVQDLDPDGVLWYGNPDMCCYIRKVEPLAQALDGFDAQITGRKGFHGGDRADLPIIEAGDDGRIKINPLVAWGQEEVDRYFAEHDLPVHPLVADGCLSIGCMPCTDRVAPGEDVRAGRWRGRGKTECGIHLPKGRWQVMGID